MRYPNPLIVVTASLVALTAPAMAQSADQASPPWTESLSNPAAYGESAAPVAVAVTGLLASSPVAVRTTPYAYVCLYAAAAYAQLAQTCNNRFDPGTAALFQSLSAFFVMEAYFDNTGGPGNEPTVDAFAAAILFQWLDASGILSNLDQTGFSGASCSQSTSSGQTTQTCSAPSVPNESKRFVTAHFDASQSAGGTFQVTAMATASNSINNNFNTISVGVMVPAATGTIAGVVRDDLRGTGVFDAGDPPIQGFSVFLDGNGNSTIDGTDPTTMSGTDGSFTFTDVPAGPGVLMIEHSTYTGPQSIFEVNVPAGGTVAQDIFVFRTPMVRACTFDDLNGDGSQGPGDPLLGGVNLGWVSGGASVTGVTGSDGCLDLPDLVPGTVTVTTSQEGRVPTEPVGTFTRTLELTSGSSQELIWGSYEPVKIAGRKTNDLDGDGTKDADEPGLSGWTISIQGGASTQTVSDGTYLFEGLVPGSYTLTETQQAGWTASVAGGESCQVTGESGGVLTCDFYNYQPPEITGRKWQDDNGDGLLDGAEGFVGDWEIFATGPTTVSTTTASDGTYSLAGLQPGTYMVTEGSREGWTQRFPTAGSYEVAVLGGDLIIDKDFGNEPPPTPPGQIHGWKYIDWDGDDERDDNEYGINGVTLQLTNSAGAVVQEQVTHSMDLDDNGFLHPIEEMGLFWFENVEPGEYTLVEVVPAALVAGSPVSVAVTSGGILNGILIPNRAVADDADWGDLPDQRIDAVSPCPLLDGCYSTLNANFGPVHLIPLLPFVLGEIIDGEPDGQPTAFAHGDDDVAGAPLIDYRGGTPGFADDEDGLISVSIQVDGSIRMEVRMTDPLGGTALLDAWIDLNDDGFLSDGGVGLPVERIFTSAVLSNGINVLNTGPFGLLPDETLGFLRLRLSSVGNLTPYGLAFDGEVEDYYDIAMDFGDAPANEDPDHPEIPFGYPTRIAQNGARHGLVEAIRIGDRVDPESDGRSSTFADGDDDHNFDDEDGIDFAEGFVPLQLALRGNPDDLTPVPGMVPGRASEVVVAPSVVGSLDAWFDWNRDGDWDDDGEWVIVRERVVPASDTVMVQIPATAQPGFTFARFRFTANGTNGPGMFARHGEVEDYLLLTVSTQSVGSSSDAGDASPGDGVCDDGAGVCTLRAAIEEANATGTPVALTFPSSGKRATIVTPQSPLPEFTAPIVLLGGGQLEIDGSQAGSGTHGLVLASAGSTVSGTTIHSFDGDGIRVVGSANMVLGDSLAGNGGAGVRVVSGSGNRISRVSISGNAGGGIDLGDDGVTPNDVLDADAGPNGLQNAPVVSLVTAENAHFEGSLSAAASSRYTVEFYASPSCHASGFGQGARYLGSTQVETDLTGVTSFAVDLSGVLTVGEAVTTTATGEDGSTSEFSECNVAVSTGLEQVGSEVPEGYWLAQNYPNPFNPQTTIRFGVPESELVHLAVYDVLGKEVAVLINKQLGAGSHEVVFDAGGLPSGVYVYRLTTGRFGTARILTLLR